MMGRFYRLQREGREMEARALYEAMMVPTSEAVTSHIGVGVLLRIDPEEPASDGRRWVASPRRPQYAALAIAAEARGKSFEAFSLLGKALDHELMDESPCLDELAGLHNRRAACAMAAGLASCAVADATSAVDLGETAAHLHLAAALEALGRINEAIETVSRGLLELGSAQEEVRSGLVALEQRLRHRVIDEDADRIVGALKERPMPTPAELQAAVEKAVHPDGKASRLYVAVLPVAMSWWQELSGDYQKWFDALTRIAGSTRNELAAVDRSVRPLPLKFVRTFWDEHESQMKMTGALVGDLDPMPSLWSALAQEFRQTLGDEKHTATVFGCDSPDHILHKAWQILGGLAAELQRVYNIRDLQVLSQLRISRLKASEGLSATKGPEVDNGGLLPDNRREVSLCFFVPVDGHTPGPSATLLLHMKDGEQTLSQNLQAGRVFVWWSRQTFHQVLGGDAYFLVSCWGVVPQKMDRSHR